MQQSGSLLVNTSLMAVGSNVVSGQWRGGWGVLAIGAVQFAPIVNLMFNMGPGTSAYQVKMNSTNIAANAIIPLQLPAGTYEIHSATGSSIGMYATLVPTS